MLIGIIECRQNLSHFLQKDINDFPVDHISVNGHWLLVTLFIPCNRIFSQRLNGGIVGFMVSGWPCSKRVTQAGNTLFGQIENGLLRFMVLLIEHLQIVFDTGDCLGQGIEHIPVGHTPGRQYLLIEKSVASIENCRRTGQLENQKRAAHIRNQPG